MSAARSTNIKHCLKYFIILVSPDGCEVLRVIFCIFILNNMIQTNKTIAAAYADTILNTIWEKQDKETTLSVLETVEFLIKNYGVDPYNGYSNGDKLFRDLVSLQADIKRTISMNSVLGPDDKYFISILNRIIK